MGETTLDSEDASSAELRVGRVLSRAAGIYRRHFATFFLLTAIATSPTLLFFLGSYYAGRARGSALAASVAGNRWGAALDFLLGMASEAVVVYGAFQDMRGRPVRLGESLRKGMARFLPVIGASIGIVVAVGLGTLLLVVPGIMVYCSLAVAIPACVVEQSGPFECLGRSAYLTKGYRWKIFGVYVLAFVAVAIAGAIAVAVVSQLGGIVADRVAQFVSNAFIEAFGSVIAVVLYHDLRVVKEGIDTERIAAVFD
ncbi:MAG TPA: hypothetical protein VET85_11680 [Stellaceae bacterium]|nr:hypothetical protein [Stellaceae bacterium]